MSNNKQSSVEWLISQLQKSKDWHRVLNDISQMNTARIDIIAEAKAMHKEEVRVAYMEGSFAKIRHFNGQEFIMPTMYYNETYGGNNE